MLSPSLNPDPYEDFRSSLPKLLIQSSVSCCMIYRSSYFPIAISVFKNDILLKCGKCGEKTTKKTGVCLDQRVALEWNRKTYANLLQKCKLCGRVAKVTMIQGYGQPLDYLSAELGTYVPLMLFECSGCEPMDFQFAHGWEAESTKSAMKFENINLSGGNYADFDAIGRDEVKITKTQAFFEVLPKGKWRLTA